VLGILVDGLFIGEAHTLLKIRLLKIRVAGTRFGQNLQDEERRML